jgi:hypothetical protein
MGRVMRITACAAMAIMAFATMSAWAGPPFITDDPEPVPLGHWEIYLGGTFAHDRGEGDGAQAPLVEVNYGAFPEIQLHLLTSLNYTRPTGGPAEYGPGDTELGLKWRFIKETDHFPQVGTFPMIELPTGDEDRGLGNGKAQVFIPIWLQKSWDKWTIYGGGGWEYNPGDDKRNFWRTGVVLQKEVIEEKLIVGGEIFYFTADARDANARTGFNLGAVYNFDEHKHLLLSVGRDIQGPNLISLYVAFQLTF